MQQDITAIILTKNEEKNIGNCLKSIKDHVKRIVVVDSGSSDSTIEIAKKMMQKFFITLSNTMPNNSIGELIIQE